MIVYKELSSLCKELGFSARALYSVSNAIEKHYHNVEIPKGNGEFRKLKVPDDFLKAIQKRIVQKLLVYEEISQYAMAYRYGGSTVLNAMPHVGQPVVLKLDIRHFFDHILYPAVKEKVFPKERFSESNRILLTILCIYDNHVPQGAPTSPFISNIILKDFDNTIGAWCKEQQICYTRYCDDMTFSGDFEPQDVMKLVKKELFQRGFFLNKDKTVMLKNGQKKQITGIVVNDRISVPSGYKKELRKTMHYCMKYGVESHLRHEGIQEDVLQYTSKLLGRINYVLSVEKDNEEIKGYREWVRNMRGVRCISI